MRLFRVDEDFCVFHWVLAGDADHAKALAEKRIEMATGAPSEAETIGCERVEAEKELTFHFGGMTIKHTAAEWEAIYLDDGERYVACSEW